MPNLLLGQPHHPCKIRTQTKPKNSNKPTIVTTTASLAFQHNVDEVVFTPTMESKQKKTSAEVLIRFFEFYCGKGKGDDFFNAHE